MRFFRQRRSCSCRLTVRMPFVMGFTRHDEPDPAGDLDSPGRRRGDRRRARGAVQRVPARAVSRHLKVLEQAGLVSRTRRATARLSRLEAEPLREVTTWLAW